MKCVLIIGGSSSIGISLANYFLNNNYKVVLGYNKHKPNISLVDVVKCDVRIENDIENIINYCINKYGNIDILFNMAAINRDSYFLDKTKSEFISVLEVNLVGTFLCNKIYSKYIDNGLIINMGSTDGIDTCSEYSIDYGASKAGINSITKSISMCTNNRVICINPNWIDTDSTNNMDKDYLDRELKRIKQSRLITIPELIKGIDMIINNKYNSGDIFRIDIRDEELWIEKMQ